MRSRRLPLGQFIKYWQSDFNTGLPLHLQMNDPHGFIAGLCDGAADPRARGCYSAGITAVRDGDGYQLMYPNLGLQARVSQRQLERLKET
jgi:hypothetical protein